MAEEIRRSGRATKGRNPKKLDDTAAAVPSPRPTKKARKSSNKVFTPEPTPSEAEDPDAIIRCICGATTEDKDDERMMICCDQCSSWQHNECMELEEDEDKLPAKYLCEICEPENHKELLAKVARGEKPWEERAKERERQAYEKKGRRRKGGKRGKPGKRGKVVETSEHTPEANGSMKAESEVAAPNEEMPEASPAKEEIKEPTPEPKPPAEKPAEKPARRERGSKRKTREVENEGVVQSESEKEPQTKIRKVDPQQKVDLQPVREVAKETINDEAKVVPVKASELTPKGRAKKVPPPSKKSAKAGPLQTELVESVSDLQDQIRRGAAGLTLQHVMAYITQAESQGKFTAPEGRTNASIAEKVALEVENAMFVNLAPGGEIGDAYRKHARSVAANLKLNPTLIERLLQGDLTPDELSKMKTEDMASKDRKEQDEDMKKEAERQHVLIKDEGPRIRRTHKGEEYVNDESSTGNESIFTAPARRRESVVAHDTEVPMRGMSPPEATGSPRSPVTVELPEDVRGPFGDGSPGSPVMAKPPKLDTEASAIGDKHERKSSTSNFNIQDVWSHVQKPDDEKHRLIVRRTSGRQGIDGPAPDQNQGPGDDPEIDQLLKDEDIVESPPYSPPAHDYDADPAIIWRGQLSMANVADFSASAKHAAGADLGSTLPWTELIPSALVVDGRIPRERAEEYLCGLRWSRTNELVVVSISATGDPTSKAQFDRLFAYFNDRKRYGVILKNLHKAVKDTYVIPVPAAPGPLPEFLANLEYCALEESPRDEPTVLVAFVVRANNPSASATPGNPDGTMAQQFSTPVPIGQPGSFISPINTYPNLPGPGQGPRGNFQNSPTPQYPRTMSTGSRDDQDAWKILGPWVNAPSVRQLLEIEPTMPSPQECLSLRHTLDNVPEAQADVGRLRAVLLHERS